MARSSSSQSTCRSQSVSRRGRATARDFAVQLLESATTDQLEPDAIVSRLAAAFRTERAGLALLLDGMPVLCHLSAGANGALRGGGWPWEGRPELLAQVVSAPAALPVQLESGEALLLAAAGTDGHAWLLWLAEPGKRSWSKSESSALTLAALAVARRLRGSARGSRVAACQERALVEQRLDDTGRAVARLVHDFNNVLTGVLGFGELGQSLAEPGSRLAHYLREVIDAAQRGVRLSSQLRLVSQRAPGRVLPLDVGGIVQEAAERCRSAWGHLATIEVDIPHDLPAVALDLEALQEALGHLLANARDALEGAGQVRISARTVDLADAEAMGLLGCPAPGRYVVLVVADTGRGLPPEVRRRVFAEPFFSTRPRHRGLGLALVYGVVRTFQGGFRLEPGEARGAVARLFLPVAQPAVVPKAPPMVASATGEQILVVDDDPLLLRMMSATLEKAGYQVQTAGDGDQALALFAGAGNQFRLVLSDITMPRMSGYDLARSLWQHNPRIPVLLTSGTVPVATASAKAAGRHLDLLAKPFRPEELLLAVRTALERPTCPT